MVQNQVLDKKISLIFHKVAYKNQSGCILINVIQLIYTLFM